MSQTQNPLVASTAKLSFAMLSPLRARIIADLLRGQNLEEAHRRLLLEKRKPAKVFLKLLKSAMSNAQQKNVASLDRLFVSEVTVNDGPRISRFMPRAQGRADARITRTSHIVLKLAEKRAAKKAKKLSEGEAATTEKKAVVKKAKKTTKKSGAK